MTTRYRLDLIFTITYFLLSHIAGEVRFGEVKTVLRLSHTFPSLNETGVFFIKQNLEDSTKFFIGANNSILSARLWPENQRQLEVVAGSVISSGYREGEGTEARFSFILGFVQTDEGLIVTDAANHCLRLIQPPTTNSTKWRTSTYAGRCQYRGTTEGRFLNARFSYPFGLLNQNNFLYITDLWSMRLRQLNMISGETATIHKSNSFGLKELVFGRKPNEFYVTVNHGILKISEGKESWLVGWKKEMYQQHKKSFSNSGFWNPEAITWLNEENLLVTDLKTRSIKIVNLTAQEVDVICPVRGIRPRDGNIKTCLLINPSSVLVLNNTILMGERDSIRSLEYETLEDIPTRAPPTTTTSDLQITTRLFSFDQCDEPPSTSNADYEPREIYPEGSTVHYQCANGYIRTEGSNNRLVCSYVKEKLFWIGARIECLPSVQMITASVLAAICICTVIAIVVSAVKIRSINKQLEEATGRQTQLRVTHRKSSSIGAEAEQSNQTFFSQVGRTEGENRHRDRPLPANKQFIPKPAPRRGK